MFECTECYKTFTRKDSLLRHLRTKHKDFSIHTDKNKIEQSTSQPSSNFFDKNVPSNLDDMSSRQDNNSMSSFEDNNDDNNSGYSVTKNDTENNSTKFQGIPNTLNERIKTASQAIQSKFNSLQRQYASHEFEDDKKDNSAMISTPKLTQILQTLLDILMIKELQVSNIKYDNGSIKSMEGNVQFQNFTNEEEAKNVPIENFTEEEAEEAENVPIKRLKYNNYTESKNEDYSNNQSENTLRKYWHNPNTLVNELRKLETATDIGEEIFTIIRRLNENNFKNNNFFTYVEHEKDRSELIKKLKELKKTVIGQEIFSVINELLKVGIIERIPGNVILLTSDEESESDDDHEKDNTDQQNEDFTENQEEFDSDKTEHIGEKTTMGSDLYIWPYTTFSTSKIKYN